MDKTKRFWDKVTVLSPEECWEWNSAKLPTGYGTITVTIRKGLYKKVYAHRFSYELHIEAIPDGLDCLHLCDNPSCVNPFHLFLGTQTDNMKDRDLKGRGRNQYTLTQRSI